MEKRHCKRIKVDLKAERISGNQKYSVFIENISETGIQMITSPSDGHKKYTPGAIVDLNFKLPSGEALNLNCRIKWAYFKMPPEQLTDSIGLEIINPPEKYITFVKSLSEFRN